MEQVLVREDKQKNYNNETEPLAVYLKQISKYSLLSFAEEQVISAEIEIYKKKLKEIKAGYDKCEISKIKYDSLYKIVQTQLYEKKDEMINSNLRLVVSIANKYRHRGLALLDLINEGNIGLIEAVDRFEYRKGYRFSTYASWWIRQSMEKSLADMVRTIRLPVYMHNKIREFNKNNMYLTQKYGRKPTTDELSAFLDTPVANILELMKNAQDVSSLDSEIDNDSDSDSKVKDFLIDEHSNKSFEDFHKTTLLENINVALKSLSDREGKIIQLRYGLSGEKPYTLDDAGKVLGITRERVRQIQQKAIEKLKMSREIMDYEYII